MKSLICICLKGRHSSRVELKNVIRNDGEASMKNLRRQRVRRGAKGWPQAQRIKDISMLVDTVLYNDCKVLISA